MECIIGRDIIISGNDFHNYDQMSCVIGFDVMSNKIAMRLYNKILCNGIAYSHAVASPRGINNIISRSIDCNNFSCNIVWVPMGKFDAQEPMGLHWWRGGGAAISDLAFMPKT